MIELATNKAPGILDSSRKCFHPTTEFKGRLEGTISLRLRMHILINFEAFCSTRGCTYCAFDFHLLWIPRWVNFLLTDLQRHISVVPAILIQLSEKLSLCLSS